MGFEVRGNAFFTVDYGSFLRQTYRPFYISGSYIVLSNRPQCNFHYTCRHTRPLVLPFVGNMMLFFAWAQDNTKSICVYIKHMATYFDCIWETYVHHNMWI